jgi:hypothetical protein
VRIEGEILSDTVAGFPAAPGLWHLIPDYREGFLRIDRAAYPQVFMQDVDLVQGRALAVTQKPLAAAIFGAKAGKPAQKITRICSRTVCAHDHRQNEGCRAANERGTPSCPGKL